MARVGLILAWSLSALAQRVVYTPVSDDTLDARLERAQRTNEARATALQDLLRDAGCAEPNLAMVKVRASKLPNIVCTLPGETEDRIVVGAHYDKVNDGMGAIDNWTGASMLVSLYQSYNDRKPRHTILFVGFTDEEKGLLGSRDFVDRIPKRELPRYKLFINMDSLAAGPLHVWLSRSWKPIIALASNTAQAVKADISAMNVDQVGDSDSHPFHNRKIPVIDFHSIDDENFKLLHSSKDELAAVSRERYHEAYRYLAVFLGVVDIKLPELARQHDPQGGRR